eukprot:TRINITY_DN2693_c0_g1_i1.p1 TRINITY_DN2693_c0_g1~~TRINITY_DN2693_c0_g1_i1.p1  ORF type:complete len:541 (-),score=163.80 TRINITY_DN2693_c0_g1_i1:261-1883(-)
MDALRSAGLHCIGGPCGTNTGRNRIVPGASLSEDLGDILELREDRKIHVIHRIGSLSPPSREEIEKGDESEDYWFENAFPSRGRLPLFPPPTLSTPKHSSNASASHRIFNKFEPQEPRKIPEVNNTPMLPVSSSNRLTRKTIVTEELYDYDDDEDDLGEEGPKSDLLIEALCENSQILLQITADTTSSLKAQEGHNNSVAHEYQSKVINIPDPGESETDSIGGGEEEETGDVPPGKGSLGGNANIAFDDSGEDLSLESQTASSSSHNVEEVVKEAHDPPRIPEEPLVNEKPLIFFIHGIGGSASIWKTQIAYFSMLGFEVLAPDLLGHGFSSTPDNHKAYTFRKLLCDLLKIFDHYVYPRRKAIIVGHGYGCSFATAMSRVRNQNVIHIILIGSGGPTPLSPPPPPPPSLGSSDPLCCSLFNVFSHCRRKKQRLTYQKSLKFPKSLDVPKYVFNHIIKGQSWPEGDVTFHRKINIPTLLVYGLKDPYVSLVEMCEMERTITKSYLELLPMAGHFLMIDHGSQLNSMIRKFMEKYENHFYD